MPSLWGVCGGLGYTLGTSAVLFETTVLEGFTGTFRDFDEQKGSGGFETKAEVFGSALVDVRVTELWFEDTCYPQN